MNDSVKKRRERLVVLGVAGAIFLFNCARAIASGAYWQAAIWGLLAVAVVASMLALRSPGLPGPVASEQSLADLWRQPGFWQMALLGAGFAIGAVGLLLWAIGLWGGTEPLHYFGYIGAACGAFLAWKAWGNLRGMRGAKD
jgi:hypothetical protein